MARSDTHRYHRDISLLPLLDSWSRQTPSACAVRDGDTELSYGELARRANALAHRLVAHGVDIGQRVGVVAHCGVGATVAMAGILKAGGAYVPLDSAYPPARLAMMAEEAGLSCVVAAAGDQAELGLSTVTVDQEESAEPPPLTKPLTGADLAYVMFTSGSTGRPKAVGAPHRAISRLVVDTDYVSINRHDTMLHHSLLSFDGSTFEIWGALLNGARLLVADPHLLFSPNEFSALLDRESVTVGMVTTAVFHQLATERPEVFAGLHTLLVGGEALSPTLARAVLANQPPQRLLNGYGPTENTVFTTTYLVNDLPENAETVPIGSAIAYTTCYIQRADGSRAGVGEKGELLVGGDGLATGYLNDAALTDEKFVANPFGAGRLYRTGDVCSLRPDGDIEFHGRGDSQVKLHGHRIELTEVESALRTHPRVANVAVTKQETATDAHLVAHVVVTGEPEPPGAAELRSFLSDRIPRYLVPAAYRLINRVPLTPQGKVDRSALVTVPLETNVEPVEGSLLDQVRSVWLDTLQARGLAVEIESEQTLFDVGGTSFDVLAIHDKMVKKFGVSQLTPLDMFTYPTLSGYTEYLADLLRVAPQ